MMMMIHVDLVFIISYKPGCGYHSQFVVCCRVHIHGRHCRKTVPPLLLVPGVPLSSSIGLSVQTQSAQLAAGVPVHPADLTRYIVLGI